ncbi:MAG: citrate transporter, partial [Clostridia bacterium]|nr:citrate transporter [Clostridia bacterium]
MKSKLLFIKSVIKNNTVAVIAFFAALITSFFVPPDKEYIGYFDFRTLTCLFCVLAVVMALKNVRFFYTIARKIVRKFKTARMSVLALVYITFIGSMLIANDMALLTFLPLGFLVLHTTGKRKYMAFTFIMQNIAANLGGMLTPFGNPQNLYLYSKFEINELEFLLIMFPPFILAIALITVCCLIFVKAEPLEIDDADYNTPKGKVAVYLLLFALAIVIVFRAIPYFIGLVVIIPVLLIMDRRALLNVDYGLLLT